MAPPKTAAWSQSRRNMILVGIAISTIASFLAWVIFTDSLKTGLIRALSIASIYALPMIFSSAMLMPSLGRRIDKLPAPWDWGVYIVLLIGMSAVCITFSSGVMVLSKLVPPNDPWPALKSLNRLAFAFCLLFSSGARLLETTRVRLEQRNSVLEEKIAAEANERKIHTQDMERAWEIQQALFPKQLPKLAGCSVSAGCQPARVVGGDYFDVIQLAEHKFAIAIADVVGKGMSAALLMSNLQAIVRSFVLSGISPADLCKKANEVIAGNIAPGKFITFFCAVVDTQTMTIDYCNAGHNPPLLVAGDGTLESLTEGGPLLGIFPDAQYLNGSAALKPGAALVLFTDGITEAQNAAGEDFGEQRLLEVVKSSRIEGGETVRQSVLRSVHEFAGDSLQDDATLVVVTAESTEAKSIAATP